MTIDYAALYAPFDRLTPLPIDCGRLCSHACCRGSGPDGEAAGMRLYPGEAAFLAAAAPGGIYRCGGACDRARRPLACRVFPLAPYLSPDGRVTAVYDPRAWRLCPLVRGEGQVRITPAFVRMTRHTGRLLAADSDCCAFLAAESREIDEINRFLRLERQRPPIARRPIGREDRKDGTR